MLRTMKSSRKARIGFAAAALALLLPLIGADCEPVQWPPNAMNATGVNPTGVLDAVTGGTGEIRVTGWASEFANFGGMPNPTKIAVLVNSTWVPQVFVADRARPDVAVALHSIGQDGYIIGSVDGNIQLRPDNPYGFDFTVPAEAGEATVCVTALNQFRDALNTYNKHVLLGCRTVTVT